MVKVRLRHVVDDVDKNGNRRRYFRRRGSPKVRLRGEPGSKEFMDAYQAALTGSTKSSPRAINEAPLGSFRHLCIGYYGSDSFKALDPSTRAWRRRALDEIALVEGAKPVSQMKPQHIIRLRSEKAATPGAAQSRLKALRALFAWAVENGQTPHNPTIGVRQLQHTTNGHHAWTLEEIEKFEARHPVGTQARLAMALLLNTAGRREDAVRLGPQHARQGRIRFRQAKNEHRNPVHIDIPQHPDLAIVIEATRSNHMTFLVTAYGRPFSPAGFGNKFRTWCDEAGLEHCSAHGLRKAAAVRLAEAGATAHEIMSVTGHRSLEEVEKYTRSFSRSRLADSAMARLKK